MKKNLHIQFEIIFSQNVNVNSHDIKMPEGTTSQRSFKLMPSGLGLILECFELDHLVGLQTFEN